MQSPDVALPSVVLPEPVDRRVRLGPFPSARDALKFATYAAVGAVLAPFATPFAWVPVVAAGFAVSVWRPDGEAVDERAARVVLFHARRWRGRPMPRRVNSAAVRGPVADLAGGMRVAIVRSTGTPLAYRPPAELAAMFDRVRELLRATEGPLFVLATAVPIRAGPVRPPKDAPAGADAPARAGYVELVTVLCRRRRTRRVDIALRASGPRDEGDRRLLERVDGLSAQLAGLGLSPITLTDRSLVDAVRSYGWTLTGGPA
jgi:hypothetical protein